MTIVSLAYYVHIPTVKFPSIFASELKVKWISLCNAMQELARDHIPPCLRLPLANIR
jgi:hypothetical protein